MMPSFFFFLFSFLASASLAAAVSTGWFDLGFCRCQRSRLISM